MLPLFLIVFIDLVGFGIMMPLLPYYAKHFGAAPELVSLLLCMYSIGQFFFSPIWGRLSDRIGRKPVLLVTLLGSVAAYVATGLAPSLAALFVVRLFAGVMAGNISTAFAYVSDVTTQANRSKGMGMIGAAFGLGFIFGPVIGGFLAGSDAANADFQAPSFAAAALSLVAFLAVLAVLPESLPAEKRAFHKGGRKPGRLDAVKAVWASTELRPLIVTILLTTTAMAIMETSFTLWINGRFGLGPKAVGYVFASIGVLMALVQGGAIGPLTKRFGELKLLLAGGILLLVGLAGLPLSPTLPYALIANAFLALGYGLSQPSMNSLISRAAAPSQVGLVMGVSQSAGSLSRVLGPVISSAGFAFIGLSGPFAIAVAIMLPALWAIARLRPLPQHPGASASGTAGPPPVTIP